MLHRRSCSVHGSGPAAHKRCVIPIVPQPDSSSTISMHGERGYRQTARVTSTYLLAGASLLTPSVPTVRQTVLLLTAISVGSMCTISLALNQPRRNWWPHVSVAVAIMVLGTGGFYGLALAFGAPLLGKTQETLHLSMLLSCTTVWHVQALANVS